VTSARSPEDQTPDTFGGPDPGGREDELAGPGPEGPDTFGGPDRGDEDILREE